MAVRRRRADDSTFDLNLAPFLDIIVSIVPMLLLSMAFVQIKMVEAPTPQVVSEQTVKEPLKPETSVTLRISKKTGFNFEIVDTKGKTSTTQLALASGQLDYEALLASAVKIKNMHPEVSRLQLLPDPDITFDEIIKVMDQVRQKARSPASKVSLTDAMNSKPIENTYLFPDVIFGSIGG